MNDYPINSFKGKTIDFRLAEVKDAEFILKLRLDADYNKYLSHTEADIQKQIDWLNEYKDKEAQGIEYYYIVRRIDEINLIGTLRIYDFDIRKNSFCWGSWILNAHKTRYAALECCLFVYDFAFFELGYSHCHMDIRKGNERVINFHKKLGVTIVDSDETNLYGSFPRDTYGRVRHSILAIVNSGNMQALV